MQRQQQENEDYQTSEPSSSCPSAAKAGQSLCTWSWRVRDWNNKSAGLAPLKRLLKAREEVQGIPIRRIKS